MDPSHHLECVRQTVRRYFEQTDPSAANTYSESILLLDNRYCGRRFRYGPLEAVWFAEEDEIKFYDQAGRLASQQKRAA